MRSTLQQSEFVNFVFPLIRIRRCSLALGDAFPAGFLAELDVEFDEMDLIRGRVFFSVDRIHRAFGNADGAVDAFVGVDDEHVGAFAEAVHGADINAVGVFAFDAGFSNDVGHGVAGIIGVNP